MNLESALKYHFAKSPSLTDTSKATASDRLTGTDIMAACGMCQRKAPFGYSAYFGKMGMSQHDREKAVKLLTQYGMSRCNKVAALRKLSPNIKVKVLQILAKFAFMDYSRSAASSEVCVCCKGEGFIAKKLCTKCKGKGVISCACKDCKGRKVVVDREETENQGVPVRKTCERCSGRGYERIPASKAFKVIKSFTGDISVATWDKSIKPFYDDLIQYCEAGESEADEKLRKVTR